MFNIFVKSLGSSNKFLMNYLDTKLNKISFRIKEIDEFVNNKIYLLNNFKYGQPNQYRQ